jgi:hypothetical protein
MNSPLRFLALSLFLLTAAWAGPKREESLMLFENRRVAIEVPEGFSYQGAANDTGLGGVQLAAANDKVTASVMFLPDPEHQAATTRGRAEKMVEEFKDYVDGSVEKAMQFAELEPKVGAGTFCVFTDAKLVGQKELPSGEFVNLTSGIKTWPGVIAVFRVFSNDTDSAEYKAVMRMLRESVYERNVPLK